MTPAEIHVTGLRRHCDSVADWARAIANELGFDDHQVDRIELAGRLHDIGKINIPRAILDKPGPLDELEWRIVRSHPEEGARLLSDAGYDDIRPWVLFHHEAPDGGGYPYGLKGDDVPLEACIISVADAWSAMTSDRCYRAAMPASEAIRELRAGAGTQWDTRCVSAMLSVLGSISALAAV